jgi:hypothetical protein
MNTGPDRPEPLTAWDLPDARHRVIAELALPGPSNPAHQVYVLHLRAGIQMPADPRERDPDRQAGLLVCAELRRLRSAALYWVSEEMTRLCLAAAPSMPAFYPRLEDLPSPSGFIYFARPIGDYEPWDIIEYADGGQVAAVPTLAGAYQVCAASWGPFDNGGQWKRGGTWFTFYTVPGERFAAGLAARGLTAAEIRALEARRPPLRIDNEAACPASPDDHPRGEPPLEAAVRDTSSTSYWMHQVLCAFRLMATARAARVQEQPVPRPARRRAARAQVTQPDSPVHLVDVTAGSIRRARVPSSDGPRRTYTVRWMVGGHWRNQWYPATEVHRPRWIDAYVKGPAEAPLKVADTVRVFRDPAEDLPHSAGEFTA